MSETPREWKYLERRPGSNYQQLFIKGRRIRAGALYGEYLSETEPMTPAQIAEEYGLPLEAVLEAIAYAASDPAEIREDRQREERLMVATGMNDPNYKGQPRILSPQEWARIRKS